MKVIIFIFLIATVGVSAAIGLFEAPDSFHYVILGQNLLTGYVYPVLPFNTTRPTTLFGPIYGLLTAPILSLSWPWGITLVPFVQSVLVVLSAILLYRILRIHVAKKVATMGALMFLLMPFEWIFATYLMSETLTQFFLTVYIYVLSQLNRRWWATSDMLVGVAALLALTRYVFVVLFVVSIGYWVIGMRRTKFAFPPQRLFALIGIVLISAWVLFNFKTYGTWQLTSHTGRHIYNNVVVLGKLLPNPTDEAVREFFDRLPPEFVFRPWWENQLMFRDLGEIPLDRRYLRVSVSAILAHPIAWLGTVVRAMVTTPLTSPYQPAPYRSRQMHELLVCGDGTPRMTWNSNVRTPFLQNCSIQRIWSLLLEVQRQFYPYGALILLMFAIVGIIAAILSGGLPRQLAGVFLLIHLTQSATEWIEGRFLIPLYPLYVFFIVLGGMTLAKRRRF